MTWTSVYTDLYYDTALGLKLGIILINDYRNYIVGMESHARAHTNIRHIVYYTLRCKLYYVILTSLS